MARTTRHVTLRLGDLVGRSISVYLSNLLPFLLLGALVLSPWIALRLWIRTLPFDDPSSYRVASLGLVLLQSMLGFVLTGAITYGVVQHMSGRPAGIGASLAKGLSTFFGVLGTSLLCALRIVLFTLLLVIPGIIEAIRLYVAVPAAVMEGLVGNAAAERSIRLTLGSRWTIFGAWLLMIGLGMLLGVLAGFAVGIIAVSGSDEWARPESATFVWIDLAIQVVVTPFAATTAAVAYFLLRQGKENVDPTQLAAVFD